MDKRQLFGQIGLLAAGFVLGAGFRDLLISNADRRFVLYMILRELRPGMTRPQVGAILQRHRTPYVREAAPDGGDISLGVSLGLADFCILSIRFRNDALESARIRGEDGPDERFPDAPPDI